MAALVRPSLLLLHAAASVCCAAGASAPSIELGNLAPLGCADAVLETVLTPSYVYYSAATLERVVDFFRVPEQLDFSGISAQATTQVLQRRRVAWAGCQ